MNTVIIIIIITYVGNATPRESDGRLISPKTSAPQHHPITRKAFTKEYADP